MDDPRNIAPFTVIDGLGLESPTEKEDGVIDMLTGEDLGVFDPDDLITQASRDISAARVMGAYDAMVGLPGGKQLLHAIYVLLKANDALQAQIESYEVLAYCENCRSYSKGVCAYYHTCVDEDESCDCWTIRRD